MKFRLAVQQCCVCLSLTLFVYYYTGWPPKNWHHFLHALTLPNINRFSKLFHCKNQEKMCNNTITKDLTTSSLSLHYLQNVKHLNSNFCNNTSSAGWLSWIVDADRPSVEDTHTSTNTPTYLWREKVTFVEPVDHAVWGALDISQGSVATHLRCGGIFGDIIITNFLPILTVK